MKRISKADFRTRRHQRLRKKVQGTAERPRMSVFLSHRHLYVQFIDDLAGRTLAASSTQTPGFEKSGGGIGSGVELAKRLGQAAAKTALDKGIKQVVFDRGGFRFGGRVRAIADAARETGLQF